MRICPYCGENCKDDDHFCRYCGRDLSHLPMSLDRKNEMLEKAISKYKLEGWILIGQSGFEAIVKRTSHNKRNYSIWEIHNILLLVVLRWIEYAYHWDEQVTLTIDDDGHLLEKSNRDIRVVLLALMILVIICFALIFYFLIRARLVPSPFIAILLCSELIVRRSLKDSCPRNCPHTIFTSNPVLQKATAAMP